MSGTDLTTGAPTPHKQETTRHKAALELDPGSEDGLRDLMCFLGDPTWRVRKAAVAASRRFAEHPELPSSLIVGLASEENAGLRVACAEALVVLGEAAVSNLRVALATTDQDQRKFVVEALGAIGTPGAGTALLGSLDDADENVRAAVADALGRIGGADVVEELRRRLNRGLESSGDVQLAAHILVALCTARAKLDFEELRVWFEKPGFERFVYPLLGMCRDLEAVAPLARGIASGSRGKRSAAVQALAALLADLPVAGEERLRAAVRSVDGAEDKLFESLNAEEDELAEAATKLLGILGDPAIAPKILQAAACRPFVQAAVEATHRMGEKVVQPLMKAMAEAGGEERVLFLEVVESLGSGSVAADLLPLATGQETRTAEAAVRALEKLGGKEAIEPLMDLVRREEEELGRQTALALSSIGSRHPEAVAEAIRKAIDSGDMRPAWLFVLGALGRDQDRDHVSSALHHSSAAVRCAAIEAALSFHHRVDEQALIFSLADENMSVRCAAANALGAYRSRNACEALLAATRDSNSGVAAAAVRALGGMEDPRVAPTLMAAAAGSSSVMAIAALQSLFRQNPPGLESAVNKALKHVDPEVVREALNATMRLDRDAAATMLATALGHRSWHVRLAAAEILASRRLTVPEALVQERLALEGETLVIEALEQLASRIGIEK